MSESTGQYERNETPPPVMLYTPEALEACQRALATIVAKIGAWGPRLVLFGGMAPRYIVPDPAEDLEPHTGTTDLDVVIGVAILDEDESVYTKLQQELTNAGFSPRPDASFAWERAVDGVPVVLEFFCPVEKGSQPGRLRRNPAGEVGSKISAIQMKGGELAGADCTPRTIEIEILDHGGHRRVDINVVNLLPFVVLKAFALESRDKEKDAYDLVWTINAFGDGPASAAEAAAQSPIADDPLVAEAMELLTQRFGRLEDQGPSNYARFFLGASDDDDARDRLRRVAAGAIQRFLARWREVRP